MYEDIEQLYLKYCPELRRFLTKYCSDANAVDDLIQSTFLEALKSMESFKQQASWKTWLFAIAKHQLYRHYRKHKQPTHPIDELSYTDRIGADDIPNMVLAKEVMQAVNELPKPHRDIMRLRLIVGLSFKEIGIQIGQSENYCRVNYYRTKEKLRKELHADEL